MDNKSLLKPTDFGLFIDNEQGSKVLTSIEDIAYSVTGTALSPTVTTLESKLSTMDEEIGNKASKTAATTSSAGLMSAADKAKLDGIATGATKNSITTSQSTNPGQTTLTHEDTFTVVNDVTNTGDAISITKQTFKMPSAATPLSSWLSTKTVTVNGVEIGLQIVNDKIELYTAGETKYATLSTSTNSVSTAATDGATTSFTITGVGLSALTMKHYFNGVESTSYLSYYNIDPKIVASTGNTFTITKLNSDYGFYDNIAFIGTAASGYDGSQLSVTYVTVTIPATESSEIAVTGVTLTSPANNISQEGQSNVACSYSLSPSNATTGLATTLKLYTTSAHTTEVDTTYATVVNGKSIHFVKPYTVYPQFVTEGGYKTSSTVKVTETKSTPSIDKYPTSTEFTAGDAAFTVSASQSMSGVDSSSIKLVNSTGTTYFSYSVDTSGVITITPPTSGSSAYYITEDVTSTMTISGSASNTTWYNTPTSGTMTITMHPKSTTTAKGYYAFKATTAAGIAALTESDFTELTDDTTSITLSDSDNGTYPVVLSPSSTAPSWSIESKALPGTWSDATSMKAGITATGTTKTINGVTYNLYFVSSKLDTSAQLTAKITLA